MSAVPHRTLVARLIVGVVAAGCSDDSKPQERMADSADSAPDSNTAAFGNFGLSQCQLTELFACCAWDCPAPDLAAERPPTADCRPKLPMLSVSQGSTYFDCFAGRVKTLYDSYHPDSGGVWTDSAVGVVPPDTVCGYLNADACDVVVECVREKGAVEVLENMGYPPPGAECPGPIYSDTDAGGDDGGP